MSGIMLPLEGETKLIGEREVIRPTVSRTRKGGFFAEPGHSVSRGDSCSNGLDSKASRKR